MSSIGLATAAERDSLARSSRSQVSSATRTGALSCLRTRRRFGAQPTPSSVRSRPVKSATSDRLSWVACGVRLLHSQRREAAVMDVVFGLWADAGAAPDHGGGGAGALGAPVVGPSGFLDLLETIYGLGAQDRKRVVYGKSVSVRVDLGGRRFIQNKKK